jgi:prepilin-type processing-associated H-X9-DG protein
VETGTLPPNYAGGIATGNGAKGIAITNYNAIVGTHIDPAVFRGITFDMGRKLAAMTDGTSKVPLVAETRERRFSSWYDGTMNWVVAARHSNPTAGTVALDQPVSTTINTGKVDNLTVPAGRLIVGTDGTTATGGSALNYGPTLANPTAVYLPTGSISDPDISGAPPGRLWGPSSEHRGGIVNHLFADGHVDGIADTIDPNCYLWIVTRNGGEPTP